MPWIPQIGDFTSAMYSRGANVVAPWMWNGLRGSWPFMEGGGGGGTITKDFAGFGNDGILEASMTESDWVSTDGGVWCPRALDFDGGGDYVDCGYDSSLQFGSAIDFSMSAWIKTSSSLRQDIAGGGDAATTSDGKHWEVFVWTNGTLSAFIDDGTNTAVTTADGATINDGNWHHVVVIFDRDGNVTRYVDGDQTGTQDSISSVGDISSTEGTAIQAIGRRGNFVGTYFDGLLDDIRIYNRALPASQAQELYHDGGAIVRPRTRYYSIGGVAAAGGGSVLPQMLQHGLYAGTTL